MSVQVLCPFLRGSYFFTWSSEFFIWISTPYQIYHLQILSPTPSVSFSFCGWVPSPCRSFLVRCSPVYFCSCHPCLRRHIQKYIAKTDGKSLLPMFYIRSFTYVHQGHWPTIFIFCIAFVKFWY